MITSSRLTSRSRSRFFLLFLLSSLFTLLSPQLACALDFYVDAVVGNDLRSPVEAQSPATPWRTISHALQNVLPGNTIRVLPGTYVESAETGHPNVALIADGAPGTVIIQPPAGKAALVIDQPDVLVEGFVLLGGTHGVRAEADGARIRGCRAISQQFNGFTVVGTSGSTIENSTAASSGSRGIFIDHASEAYVRNNLVYGAGEWGIDFENTNASEPQPPLSTGNVVAFNTVAYNGDAPGEGGIRLKNAIGQVRDNVIVGNTNIGLRLEPAGTSVHHNLLFGNATPVSPESQVLGPGMLLADPLFVDPDGVDGILGGAGWADDSFALSNVAAGQGANSPAIDAGSGSVAASDIGGSTRSDLVDDSGTADLGFHDGAPASTGIPPVTSGPATYYVDAVNGDDLRGKILAQSPATPWRSITRALNTNGAASGDTVVVAAGTYAEAVATTTGGITLRANGNAVITPPAGQTGITVNHSNVLIDGFGFQGGGQAVRGNAAHGLTVRDCTTSGQTATAITLVDTNGAMIEDNVLDSPNGRGILLERSSGVHVVGNTVTSAGEWGIDFANAGSAAVSAGNVIAENTVSGSGRVLNAGSVKLDFATGTVRDNALTGGQHGVRATSADGLVLRGNTVDGPGSNGLYVLQTSGVLVDGNDVRNAGERGILLVNTSGAYVRNNLVADSGEWGIQLNNASTEPLSLGNVVAFNTVARNGGSPATIDGGIRFQNATGEIRDNIVWNNDSKGIKVDRTVFVHHNDVVGSDLPHEHDNDNLPIYLANLAVDPIFADAANGDFRLQATSPVIDQGSGAVASLDISGATRVDGTPDTGVADMGRHVEANPSSGTPPPPGPTPTPKPGPTPTPQPGAGDVHYVDCAGGSDSNSKEQAKNPATPWKTIQKAANTLTFGDIAVVATGTCEVTSEIEIDRAGITLRAAQPFGTTVRRTTVGTTFNVQAHHVTLEGFVIESLTAGVRAAVSDSDSDLFNLILRGLLVRPIGAGTISTNGIQVRDAENVTVEDSIVTGASQQGILLKRVVNGFVHNNLVYGNGDWGISFDNWDDSGGLAVPPLSTGNIAAFNTVYGNVRGLRFVNSSGEIRDNVVAMNGPTGIKFDQPGLGSIVHHNDSFGHTTNYDGPSGFQLWASNKSVDPLFVDAANENFALSQIAAGQAVQSPLVDEGSGPVVELEISGTTQSGDDPQPDTGIADMGFHAGAMGTSGPPGGPTPTPTPSAATVWVDCANGDDTHSKWEAQFPWTAWRTIANAVAQIAANETIIVRPGACNESVTLSVANVTLRAEERGMTTVRAPAGTTGVTLRADGIVLDGFVVRSDKEGIIVAKPSSGEKLFDAVVRHNRVLGRGSGIGTNGIRVRNGHNVTVDSNVVMEAAQSGIIFRQGTMNYARNNLVLNAGEWGIHVDNGSGVAMSTGNVVAFNTVYDSGTTGAQGGIRFQKASGEIRDNLSINNSGVGIKTDTQPTYVHHNGLFGNPVPIGIDNEAPPVVWSNVELDPLFVATAGPLDFHLEQLAAGQDADSPMIDVGSGAPASRDISGSTRTDGMPDEGNADIGYHHGAAPSTGKPPIQDPPSGTTYYVNAQSGSDTRTTADALNPATPWKTISKALSATGAPSGSTIEVATGTYAEAPKSTKPNITLVANGNVIVTPPAGQIGITIDHAGFVVEGFTVQGGLHGIRGVTAPGLVVRNCTTIGQSDNGIYVADTDGFTIDGNVTRDAGKRGILVERSTQAYVRNNLVRDSGEWGMEFKNSPLPAVSTGNVVAFNTVVGSGRVIASGAIRFDETIGEIRDNVLANNATIGIETDTAPTLVHHNLITGSALEIETESGQEPTLWANLYGQDPRFVNAAAGDFRLQQVAAGQASDSPAIDAGSGDPASRDISGSTRSDGGLDTGVADLGWHADAEPAAATPPPASTPPTGNPPPGSGPTYYVDPVNGSNAHSLVQARSPATAWQTIGHAMSQVSAGDVIALAPGTYFEEADFSRPALTLRGMGALGDVVIAPPAGFAGVNVDGQQDGRIENLVVQGGSIGIAAQMANGLRIDGVVVVTPASVGIRVRTTNGVVIDRSVVTGAGTYGILLARTRNAYVHNNLIYANAEWAVSIDANGGNTSPGNIVAFNTIHQNGNGVRLLNASGEVRDNNLTGTIDLALYLAGPNILAHHNNFSANGRDHDKETEYSTTIFVYANVGKNPRYDEPAGADGILGGLGWADDDFHLEQFDSGGEFASPVVNAGSGEVATRDIGGSTRTNGVADDGIADIGFHYGAPPAGTPPAIPPPPANITYTYYVGPNGNDQNTKATARNMATPWRTISRALQQIAKGDTVVVLPGEYPESLQIQDVDVSLIAQTPGTVTIRPPSGNGITIERRGVTVDGFVVLGAPNTGVSALAGSDDVRVRNCAVVGATQDAFRAASLDSVLFDGNIAAGSGGAGFALRKATNAIVRNNLAYDNGEWGIHVDNTPVGSEVVPVSTGNLIAENTTAFNTFGNIRLANAIGDVRDNVIANTNGVGLAITTPGAVLSHNGFFAATTMLDPPSYVFCSGCSGNVVRDPRFVDPDGIDNQRGGVTSWQDDDFRLSQTAAGQAEQSEAVDAGSATVAALGISGTTATSGVADEGVADLGFHYAASMRALPSPPPPGSPPTPTPSVTPTPSPGGPTVTPTPKPTAKPTATPTATPTPKPTVTPTATPTPTAGPTNTPTPTPSPGPSPTTLHIDAAIGDDSRTRAQASSPTTPWRTLGHAIAQAAAGDVFLVAPGNYSETSPLIVRVPDVRVVGQGDDVSDVRITAPASVDVWRIRSTGFHLENVWVDGGKRGVFGLTGADALELVDVAVTNTAAEGIKIEITTDVSIRGCIVTGAGSTAIATRRSQRLAIRDCDVYGNRASGLFIRKADAEIGFLTVHANGGRGLRSLGATLSLHDSIFTQNGGAPIFVRGGKPATLSHLLVWGNAAGINDATPPVITHVGPMPINEDPMFVDPDGSLGGGDGILGGSGWADDDLSLRQPPAQAETSPAVDAGSNTATALGVTGSTSSSGAPDTGMADLGAHR